MKVLNCMVMSVAVKGGRNGIKRRLLPALNPRSSLVGSTTSLRNANIGGADLLGLLVLKRSADHEKQFLILVSRAFTNDLVDFG